MIVLKGKILKIVGGKEIGFSFFYIFMIVILIIFVVFGLCGSLFYYDWIKKWVNINNILLGWSVYF